MKILMTNYSLLDFEGSEMFIYTVAVALRRQGHEIVCFSPRLGKLAQRLREDGITVTDDLTGVGEDIDVIHAQHRQEALLCFARFPEVPMVLVCHGILPWQEQPLTTRMHIVRYVAVSEEVRAHLSRDHAIDPYAIDVIRNGIDLSRFTCRRPIHPEPRRLLVLSNRMPVEQVARIQEACARRGMAFEKIGKPHGNVWEVEARINEADIVISLGRGVLEALACKRIAIVDDYNGADGVVTPQNVDRLREKNFSGRTEQRHLTVDELVAEFDRYDPAMTAPLYEWVTREHAITVIAGRYTELYATAMRRGEPPGRPTEPPCSRLYAGVAEVLRERNGHVAMLETMVSEKDRYIASLEAHVHGKNRGPQRLAAPRQAVCTIVSKNYLAYARVFADSCAQHNRVDIHVLLVDRIDGRFVPDEEPFTLTEISQLGIEGLEDFCFRYNVTELNTAVKPFFLDYLFRRYGYERILYFDPDILILQPLDGLFDRLEDASVLLTPHITAPIEDDGKRISEREILMAGAYNLGFIGLSHYERMRDFLAWWQARLFRYCFSAPAQGLFVDQKWIDLLPGMVQEVCILRDPGYNVAYWNLHERTVTCADGRFQVNQQPLVFYHFSGMVFDQLERISKHQNRFSLHDFPGLRRLFERYRALLLRHGHLVTTTWPYAFGAFDNGVTIHDLIRQYYGGLTEQGTRFGNPFAAEGRRSFFRWLNTPVVHHHPMTNLLHYLYFLRADLQKAFPDPFGHDRERFLQWAGSALPREYGLDQRLLPVLEGTAAGAGQGPLAWVPSTESLTRLRMAETLKAWVWRHGKRHATLINRLPLIRTVGLRVHDRLAPGRLPGYGLDRMRQAPRLLPEPPPSVDRRFGVNLAGYLDTESGVAEAARGIVRALARTPIPFVLNNIDQPYLRRDDTTYTDFSPDNPYAVNIMHVNADQVPVVANRLGDRYFHGRYNIGYWFWELADFPEQWRSSFAYFQEIWVASGFCQEAIAKVSPVPVVKIPPSIAIEQEIRFSRTHFALPEHEYLFLTMFDLLSFIERKNPMAVVEAFRQAFGVRDGVGLVIKCSSPSPDHPTLRAFRESIAGANIRLIDGYLDKPELHALIGVCDSYISLHRSEGFGLPLAEAMLRGKPVIATGYSGNMEFMTPQNSFLVDYALVELHEDYGPYKQGRVWAEPSSAHAASLMHEVVTHRERAAQRAKQGAEDIQRGFSAEAVATRIQERLGRLPIARRMPSRESR